MFSLEKRGNIFILTLTGDGEHRLNPSYITTLLNLLSQIKSQSSRGSVLLTTSTRTSRFFSNGFDLPWAQSAANPSDAYSRLQSMVEGLKPVVAAFLSLPMPTIAAIPGHAAAAGFILALCHDYIFMRKDKGVLYMSEVDLGLTVPDYFVAMFQDKIGSAAVRRDVLLRGVKFRGEEAVKMGIVDKACEGGEKTLEEAVKMGEELGKRKWDGEVYAEIRKGLYPGICGILGLQMKAIARL